MKLQRSPLQLALVYLIVAILWILCSDALLLRLGLDRETLANYQTLKGFAFVLVTGFVLYCALSQHQLEQRRIRGALKHSEGRLALALDSAQEGLWDWDMKSDQVYYSRRYCDMLGYTPEEFGATGESCPAKQEAEAEAPAEE